MKFNLAEIGLDNHLKDILIDGEGAYISKEGVQLTCQNQTRAGRATYLEPFRLWDAVSGEMADFTTNFSFVKDSRNASDEVSFFLAENTSLVTTSEAIGRHVMVPFVPVEFEKWWSNVSYEDELTVMIRYDSRSQNFSVSYRGTIVANVYELYYKVDLRSVLPEWVVLGFSSSSCNQFRRTSVRSWSFDSTILHDDTRWRKEKKKGVLVFIMVVLLFATIAGLFHFILIRKNRSRPVPPAAKSWAPREFSFKELSIATDKFDSCQMLGKGGFGEVYKATLANGEKVVVKKILGTSQQCIKEYEAEVLIVGGAQHKHIVKLIGWSNEINKDLLVVYELMENKSLDIHLFNPLTPLTWDTRYRIAHGLAKALHYLHEECGKHCILHRDIKASNVLLDSNFEAKLGDFGLAKINDHDQSVEISDPAGTIGYMAPECFKIGTVSPKSDVYSYGIVALELATGKRCIYPNDQGDQKESVKWVETMYRMKKIREIVDPRLDNYDDLQMKGLIALGLWCVRPDNNDRPLMREIAHALNNTQDPLSDLYQKIPSFDSPLESSPEIYLEIDLTEEGVDPAGPDPYKTGN
nr:L-type lectin-domain containing receptor kinase IX.1-like [Tanacetum cinerariifolium]